MIVAQGVPVATATAAAPGPYGDRSTPQRAESCGCCAEVEPSRDPVVEALERGQLHWPPNSWAEDFVFFVCNNHVLLSVVFAHPAHPYTRTRRLLVLLNSLFFAFFVVALLEANVPDPAARAVLLLTVGTVLQLVWDLPTGAIGTCPCANLPCLPPPAKRACRSCSFCCLSCRGCYACLFALAGVLLLQVLARDPHARPTHATDTRATATSNRHGPPPRAFLRSRACSSCTCSCHT